MSDFEPFDEEFNFDKSILIESFPNYMMPSILMWVQNLIVSHKLYNPRLSKNISMEGLFGQPIVDVAKVEEITGLSRPAANALVKKFVDIGILRQVDETDTYGRQFVYIEYLTLFHEPEIRRKTAEKEDK